MIRINRRIEDMAVFIEFIAGSGMAIFFHQVLHDEKAAYIIFGTGILLSLATYLIREGIGKAKFQLMSHYQQVHSIPLALAKISDTECQLKAQEIIESTLKSIKQLQNGHIPLDEMDFYLEGARLADQSVNRILAVDLISFGWQSRGTLMNFYQSNLRAIERGIQITRIFVTTRDGLNDPEVQKVLLVQHIDGVIVRLAFREELPSNIEFSGNDTHDFFDFTLYDDRAVTAVCPQTRKHYGIKTQLQTEITKYLHLYERLDHSSHPVTIENEQIVLVINTAPAVV